MEIIISKMLKLIAYFAFIFVCVGVYSSFGIGGLIVFFALVGVTMQVILER